MIIYRFKVEYMHFSVYNNNVFCLCTYAGVGENKTDKMLEELKSIATSPDHFFEVDNLDRLVDIRKNLVDVLCEGIYLIKSILKLHLI